MPTQWTPPRYATPAEDDSIPPPSKTKWKPPPYATDPNIDFTSDEDAEGKRLVADIEASRAENASRNRGISGIEKLYNAGNKSVLDYLPESVQEYRPKNLFKKATSKIREFGESGTDEDTFTNRVKKVARYGQAFGESATNVAEEFLNPINIALTGISGGSSAAFKAAKEASKHADKMQGIHQASRSTAKLAVDQRPEKLYQIAKGLEFPGKLAAGGQVAHGGHQAIVGETTEDKLAGVAEALFGAASLKYKNSPTGKKEYPIKDVTPVLGKAETGLSHGPKEQLKFPLTKLRTGNANSIPSGKFASGTKGTYDIDKPLTGELGDVSPAVAYDYGTITTNKQGKPFVRTGIDVPAPIPPSPILPDVKTPKDQLLDIPPESLAPAPENPTHPIERPTSEFNANKLESIKNYMRDIETGVIPRDTNLEAYITAQDTVAQSAQLPDVRSTPLPDTEIQALTNQNKPVSFDEILPAESQLPDVRGTGLKEGAQYAFKQPGFEELPDIEMYNVPVEGGGMTTVSADRVAEMGYALPPVGQAMQRPESLPAISPESMLPDVVQPIQQETDQLEQIGERAISDDWEDTMAQLDTDKASDIEYKYELLPQNRTTGLKKNETWRDRLTKQINTERANNPTELTPEQQAEIDAGREPQFARAFKGKNLFEGSKGEGLTKKKSFGEQWDESVREAQILGIDHTAYDNLDELQWDITKKAYQETGRTGVNPLANIPKVPESARSEQGGIKVGVNIERAADEVTTAYSGPLSGIMVREGTQNAFDAVRALGDKGKIDVKIRTDGMEITDNGKGMSRQELETVFSNLNESGKVNEENATGGKGVGKASYILGGDYFTVSTVTSNSKNKSNPKTRITIQGTREDFLSHVDVVEESVPPETSTGTTIKTKFKKGQEYYDAEDMVGRIIKWTRGLNTQVSGRGLGNVGNKDQKLNDGSTDKIIASTQFHMGGTNDVTVRIPQDAKLDERTWIKTHVLNNGMYQFSGSYYLDQKTPNIPENLIIDIHPHAREGTAEYPFPTSRESIKSELQENIDKLIKETLVQPHQAKRKSILVELYAGMVPLSGEPNSYSTRNTVMFDSGNRLEPAELELFKQSKTIQALTTFTDRRIAQIVDMMEDSKITNRLEGTGLVLDEGLYGIHIPNPEVKLDKSTILINYLAHIAGTNSPMNAAINSVVTLQHEIAHIGLDSPKFVPDMVFLGLDDPRVGPYLATYFKQIQNHAGSDPGHGFSFSKRLGDVYARNGIANALEAADELHAIFTAGNKSGGYSSEISGLLHVYQKSRGRPAVTEDVLSRTGDKSKVTGKGTGNTPENTGSNRAGTKRDRSQPNVVPHDPGEIAVAVMNLKTALQAGKLARTEQDSLVAAERSRRAGSISGVKTRGAAGYHEQLGMLKGPMPKVGMPDDIITDEDVDVLIDAITDSQQLRPFEEISAKRGLFKLLTGQAPQPSEIRLIEGVFGDSELGGMIELHAGLNLSKLPKNFVHNVLNLSKSLKASLDLSGALRQGMPFIHKKEYWSAFYNMHKYLGPEANFKAGMEAMKEHPDFDLIKETPLFLTEFGDDLNRREDQIIGTWADNIPLVNNSQRAFAGFINELRFKTMTSLLDSARKLGHEVSSKDDKGRLIATPKANEIARFVNIFTGRGGLGRFEKMAVEANSLLWSPRFLTSRFTMVSPRYFTKASPFIQKEVVKSLFTVAGVGLTTLALAKSMGAEVETEDYTSADWMKAKFGNTRLDPWAGLQQNAVAEMRILTYIHNAAKFIQGKPIPKGERFRPGAGYNSRTARDIVLDFSENKLSPLASFVSSLADLGKSYEPSGLSELFTKDWNVVPDNRINRELINLYSPMMADTITDLVKDDPSLFPLGINGLYGQSIQTYENKTNPARGLRPPQKPRLPR